jgi:hypothetical protein
MENLIKQFDELIQQVQAARQAQDWVKLDELTCQLKRVTFRLYMSSDKGD